MASRANRCQVCGERWAQDHGVCRRCQGTTAGVEIVAKATRRHIDRSLPHANVKVYVPPERPTVVARDPWTGRLVEFDVVFDGR